MPGKRPQSSKKIGHALLAGLLVAAPAIHGISLAIDPSTPPAGILTGNFDIRIHARDRSVALALRNGLRSPEEISRAIHHRQATFKAGRKILQRISPRARVEESRLTGSAELVSGLGRALTPPFPGRSSAEIAMDFLQAHRDLYGLTPGQIRRLEVLGESNGRKSGLRVVRLRQTVHGRPVFQSETRAVLDPEGRLVATVGRLVPGLGVRPAPAAAFMPASEALGHALRSVGVECDVSRMIETAGSDGRLEIELDHPEISRPVHAEQVFFPLFPEVAVPAWSLIVPLSGPRDWYIVVDAASGEPLYRKNIQSHGSTQEARFSIYAQPGGIPADSPAPASPNSVTPGPGEQFPEISRSIILMSAAYDPAASPDGWIPDGGTTTTGNNVDAFLDQDGNDLPDFLTLDLDGRPVGNPDGQGRNRDFLGSSPRDFQFTPAPSGGDPDVGDDPWTSPSARGGVTQLFVTTNVFHDRLHQLGFVEEAGNFQADNFGKGGLGGDPVLAAAQWGALFGYSSNANISVAPDGISPVVRMYLFLSPWPGRDSSLDSEILLHELAHGMTNRIIGNAAGLNWVPGMGMGEGWSDFYALSLLNSQPSDDPDGRYAAGAYSSYLLAGIFIDNYAYGVRRFPYSTDNTVNPLTWADVDDITVDMSGGMLPSPLGQEYGGAGETHNVGEVWALSLWEVRSRIIAAHGGDVELGNDVALQIVTDALALTPIDPGYTQARDALLLADCARNACAHEEAIWAGFADRGLGYGAEASLGIATHVGVRESFSLPYLDVSQITVDDSAGNGNGFIDPGETVAITVELVNPWRDVLKGVPSVDATLTTSDPDVVLLDASSAYGALAALDAAAGDPFSFTVGSGAVCGQPLAFTLQTTSDLGTASTSFVLRPGQPVGSGAPVTFARVLPTPLDIPEADPRGAVDTMSVLEDLEIADLNLRIDSLTHTAVGDLTVELKGPDGLGMDLIFRPYDCVDEIGCLLGLNAGDDFLDTIIDDEATADLMVAGVDAAPFTGAWMPALNSPDWTAPDATGQLACFDGTSTRGDWQLFIADHEAYDTGTLDAWSLIVTPAQFACDCDLGDPGIFTIPLEVTGLQWSDGGGTVLTWDSAAPLAGVDTVHDVLRGNLGQFPVGAGPGEVCHLGGTSGTTTTDTAVPPTGSGYWYLVRGRNGCGAGGYGAASDAVVRESAACP
jgi:subtilisin-like proprotein convertase family protein